MAAQTAPDPVPQPPNPTDFQFVLVYRDEDGIYRLGLANEAELLAAFYLEEPVVGVYLQREGRLAGCVGRGWRSPSPENPVGTWDLYAEEVRITTIASPSIPLVEVWL